MLKKFCVRFLLTFSFIHSLREEEEVELFFLLFALTNLSILNSEERGGRGKSFP